MDEGADAVRELVAQQAAQIQQLREELEAMKMMHEAVTPAPDDQPRPSAGSRATLNPLTADQQPGGADDGKAGEEQGDSGGPVLDAVPPPLLAPTPALKRAAVCWGRCSAAAAAGCWVSPKAALTSTLTVLVLMVKPGR